MGLKPESWPSRWRRQFHATLIQAGKRKFDLQPLLTEYLLLNTQQNLRGNLQCSVCKYTETVLNCRQSGARYSD
jgi:hypothetical protein